MPNDEQQPPHVNWSMPADRVAGTKIRMEVADILMQQIKDPRAICDRDGCRADLAICALCGCLSATMEQNKDERYVFDGWRRRAALCGRVGVCVYS